MKGNLAIISILSTTHSIFAWLFRTEWTWTGLGHLGHLSCCGGKKRSFLSYSKLPHMSCRWRRSSRRLWKGSLTVNLRRFCCTESYQVTVTCFQSKKHRTGFWEEWSSPFNNLLMSLLIARLWYISVQSEVHNDKHNKHKRSVYVDGTLSQAVIRVLIVLRNYLY